MVYGDLQCSWLCYGARNTQGMKVVNCMFPPIICKNIIHRCQNMLGGGRFDPSISEGFHPTQLVMTATNSALLCPWVFTSHLQTSSISLHFIKIQRNSLLFRQSDFKNSDHILCLQNKLEQTPQYIQATINNKTQDKSIMD